MNRRVLEGLVWLLGGSVITLALILIVYFMMAQEDNMNIDDALAVRLSVYRDTWIDYDSIEKMSNEHGWEVMGFNRDMTKIYIIESPMGKELETKETLNEDEIEKLVSDFDKQKQQIKLLIKVVIT